MCNWLSCDQIVTLRMEAFFVILITINAVQNMRSSGGLRQTKRTTTLTVGRLAARRLAMSVMSTTNVTIIDKLIYYAPPPVISLFASSSAEILQRP